MLAYVCQALRRIYVLCHPPRPRGGGTWTSRTNPRTRGNRRARDPPVAPNFAHCVPEAVFFRSGCRRRVLLLTGFSKFKAEGVFGETYELLLLYIQNWRLKVENVEEWVGQGTGVIYSSRRCRHRFSGLAMPGLSHGLAGEVLSRGGHQPEPCDYLQPEPCRILATSRAKWYSRFSRPLPLGDVPKSLSSSKLAFEG